MLPIYHARLDFAAAFAPVDRCPVCGSEEAYAVSEGGRVGFRCGACGTRWHLEYGQVVRVGVVTDGGAATAGPEG